jgi:hypothetical protein
VANALILRHRRIEAEKLAAISHCVHGPGHNCMLSADEQLEEYKKGCAMDKQYKLIYFMALRYKKDGEVCVVTLS